MLDTKEILWKNRRIRCTVQYGTALYGTIQRGTVEERRVEEREESIFENYRMTYIKFLLSSTFPAVRSGIARERDR